MSEKVGSLDNIKDPVTKKLQGKDRLVNSITGQGTRADKSSYNRFIAAAPLDAHTIEALYQDDWLAAKVIDAIPHDMIRSWRTIDGLSPEDHKAFTRAEKEFEIKTVVEEALKNSRLYGGAGILLGVEGHGAEEEPLDITKIKQGQIKYIHQLDKTELTVESIETSPLKVGYRKPLFYQTGEAKIHHTRVIPLIGIKLPYRLQQKHNYWGASVLQKMLQAIENVNVAYGSGSTMLHEASLDIISIEGLFNYIGDQCGEAKIMKRLQLAELTKSIHNALVKDNDENFTKITQNFAGIPDMLREMVIAVSGASETPITRLLGISPSGLNATGKSDLTNYYDTVSARQEVQLGPIMEKLDMILQLNEFGKVQKEFTSTFNPLWQPTRDEESEMQQRIMKGHLDASRYLPEEVIIAKLAKEGYYDIKPEQVKDYAAKAVERYKKELEAGKKLKQDTSTPAEKDTTAAT